MNGVYTFLFLAGFLVLPFALGFGLSRLLRVKEYAGKLGLILFTIGLAISPFVNQLAKGNPWLSALDLGIDLAGGTNLVYELAEQGTDQEALSDDLMNRMVSAVGRRINPAGTKEIVVRRVGQDRIEVIVPGTNPEEVSAVKRSMTQLGNLEFAIAARSPEHSEIISRAKASPSTEVRVGDKIVAVWRPIATEKDDQGKDILDAQGQPRPKEFFSDREVMRPMAGRPGRFEALLLREPEERRVTGKYLRRANQGMDPQSATPCVEFTFNSAGTTLFGSLTYRFKPPADDSDDSPNRYRLAVLLNDELQTAPGIRTPITGGNGIITGMSLPEVMETVTVLNAGALPREIKRDPISEFTVSPTLGADVQSKGKLALIVSTVAVVLFMALYYLIAGVVADAAMLLNLLFIVGAMALIDAAFTLPGLAGLVLSAGMAVDANVLIYERIREETERGASLRMAIHNGFEKAFTAIFDSNLTTLITSVILYWIGTDQIKGFAVSLFIGLVMNLFTAVFISRIVLEVMEKSRLVKRLDMQKWIGFTNIDFVSKQNIAIAISTVFVVIGLGAFVYRGESNYDIDFTGGTMISMQFNDAQQVDDVRAKLEQKLGGNITVEELSSTDTSKADRLFRLRTTDQDVNKIAGQVDETFPNQLMHVALTVSGVEALPEKAPEKKEGETVPEFDEAFAGGTKGSLAFNQEVAVATVRSYLLAEFAALGHPNEGAFTLLGTEGSGMTAAEGQVKLFKAMNLKVAKSVPTADVEKGLASLTTKFQTTPLFDEVTTFASSVAQETKWAAVFAVVLSLFAIVVYVWFRFENYVYGLAAVVALAHDVLVTLGAVAVASLFANNPIGNLLMLNDFKISMSMIAAFLTIVGYSLNDTIVIFDRLREIRGKNPHITKEMINLTVNQCLSRTILTAVTVFLSVLILYVLGGEGIHGFAFAMTIGTLAGTYSTVYIASPLVLYFMERARLAATKPAPSGKKAAPQAT
jgi:SecD/SecF fusion protein